jgi:hypothetical protein
MELALSVRGQLLSGGGMDDVGTFSIHGSFDEGTTNFFWTKRYAAHSVYYKGAYDGKFLKGRWLLEGGQGTFCLWPDGAGEKGRMSKAKPEKARISA